MTEKRQPETKRAHATLKDVAKAAGVSQAAVSRHLNGMLALPQETAERIDEAVKQLNYHPNPHARRLSRGKSDTLALVVPDIGNMFFAQLASAVEQAASDRGYGLVLCISANQVARELRHIDQLSRNYVDALLFITNHADDGALAGAIAKSGPVVLLDEDIDGAEAARLFSDNVGGGKAAARYLRAAGHRHLAYIGGPRDLMSAQERGEGFRGALTEAGNPVLLSELFGDYSIDFGREAAAQLLDSPDRPTAIFAGSDHITLGVLQAVKARGLQIPRDLSIVTFDDTIPLEFFNPPLTAIRQSIEEMGRRAVDIAIARSTGAAPASSKPERLPVTLIERASVAPPPQH